MTPILQVQNVGKKYLIQQGTVSNYKTLSETLTQFFRRTASSSPAKTNEFWALKDVSFTLNQGDRVGIIGRNGAGKSTLLKLISRVTEPTKGRIGMNGRISSLLEVGTGFHPELTGRENIFLNGAILGMRKGEIQRRFDEIVDFAGTEQFLDTPIKRYSSGMYVRLAFAVAAFLESEILIVDEVLAVGDAAFQKKCLGKMDQVSRDGRTILFVSHNLSTIESLCNRGIYLSDGGVKLDGSSLDAITEYTKETSQSGFGLGKEIDLSQVKRPGNGQIRFQSVEMKCLAKNREEKDTLRVGDDFIVEIKAKGFEKAKDLNICLILYDLHGARLVDANFALRGESI
jgi:lipopolysaccharide transport system ATP-binding protein